MITNEELEIQLGDAAETFLDKTKNDHYKTEIGIGKQSCEIIIRRIKKEFQMDSKTKVIIDKNAHPKRYYNIGRSGKK